jgi:hypothetical protein
MGQTFSPSKGPPGAKRSKKKVQVNKTNKVIPAWMIFLRIKSFWRISME